MAIEHLDARGIILIVQNKNQRPTEVMALGRKDDGEWVLAMLSMTAAGLGEHHVANWCDVGFGAIIAMPALVAVSIPKFQHKLKEAEEAEAAERKANYRRKLPIRQRWFWLFCWLILLLFQFLILHALTPFLKHP